MSSTWHLLDDKSEHELHKNRLLAVEERPFKRISKRLTAAPALVATGRPSEGAPPSVNAQQLLEDFALDFATFDSSLVRLQFLSDANERERERYREDQERIANESQSAREANAQLRTHLEGARATLAQRKRFDAMADSITSNRLLRPRDEQLVNLARLEDECRQLELESQAYSVTWRERRDQFNRIMEEGTLLRRQIRDEKEEVDRREGMDEADADAATAAAAAAGSAAHPGAGLTPRPDSPAPGPPAIVETTGADTADTPRDSASQTPAPPDGTHLQQPHDGRSRSGSHLSARSASREPSPLRPTEDEDMADHKDRQDTPQGAAGDRMDVDA